MCVCTVYEIFIPIFEKQTNFLLLVFTTFQKIRRNCFLDFLPKRLGRVCFFFWFRISRLASNLHANKQAIANRALPANHNIARLCLINIIL